MFHYSHLKAATRVIVMNSITIMLYSVQHMLKTFKQKADKKEPKKYQTK